jgi:succinyl-diaminopimelate desuccinylase
LWSRSRSFWPHTPAPLLDIAFLLTSDEEGPSVDGTKVVVERCAARGERLDYCIVGEPTSVKRTGDMIKNGRRGTLSGKLTVRGIQGHIAYPHLARNPIHQAVPALAELAATALGRRQRLLPAHQLADEQHPRRHGCQQHHSGGSHDRLQLPLLHRIHAESLKQRVHAVLDRHELEYELQWTWAASPFSPPGRTGAGRAGAIAQPRPAWAPNSPPPAAPVTAASSPRCARR